jgi:hypothetical protein
MLLAATPVSSYSCAHQGTSFFLIYNVDLLCPEAGNILEICNAAVLEIHRMCSR